MARRGHRRRSSRPRNRSKKDGTAFYPCFISFSRADTAFATKLQNDLKNLGLLCWELEPEVRPGEQLANALEQAIRECKRFIAIASESSLASRAFRHEMTLLGIKEGQQKLAGETPLRTLVVQIDDSLSDSSGPVMAMKFLTMDAQIADGRGWETDHAKYEALLDQIVRNLRI